MEDRIFYQHLYANYEAINSPWWVDEDGKARRDHTTRVTVGYKYVDNAVLFSISTCSPKDPFNKKKGLRQVRERFEKQPTMITNLRGPIDNRAEALGLIQDYLEKAVSLKASVPGLPNYWTKLSLMDRAEFEGSPPDIKIGEIMLERLKEYAPGVYAA